MLPDHDEVNRLLNDGHGMFAIEIRIRFIQIDLASSAQIYESN